MLFFHNANVKTKEELLHQMIATDVAKNKMINVAGQLFKECEIQMDESHQIRKDHENSNRDNKSKNDLLNKVLQINERQSENDAVYRNTFKRFFKNLNIIQREPQLKLKEFLVKLC